jgi:hypothetical protein
VLRLYKYLPAKYVQTFVREGAVLFRSLSYFRDFEDEQIRGDQFEGTRVHRPQGGLEITLVETQQKVLLAHSFESSANEDDIFVFCLSTVLSAELATQFQADACVELRKPARFIAGVRAALERRPSIKSKLLVHGEVNYYTPDHPPIVDWALPERIAMSKLSHYTPQREYRLAFAVNDAFRVGNTHLRLAVPDGRMRPRSTAHPELLFKLGRLTDVIVHRFGGEA